MDCMVCAQYCDPAIWLGRITASYRAQGISIPTSNSFASWLLSDDERLPQPQEQISALHNSDPRKIFEDDIDCFSSAHPNIERRLCAFCTRIRHANLSAIPEMLGVQPHDASWVGDGTNGTQAVAASAGQVYAYLKASDHIRQAVKSWLDRRSQFVVGASCPAIRAVTAEQEDARSSTRVQNPRLTLWVHDAAMQATPTLRCFILRERLGGISETEPPYTPCELWSAPTARTALAEYLQLWWAGHIHPSLRDDMRSYCIDVRFVPSQSLAGCGAQPMGVDSDIDENGHEEQDNTSATPTASDSMLVLPPIQLQNRGLKAQLTAVRPLCFLEHVQTQSNAHVVLASPVLCLFDDVEGQQLLLSDTDSSTSSRQGSSTAVMPVGAGLRHIPFRCFNDEERRVPSARHTQGDSLLSRHATATGAPSVSVRPHPLAPHAYPDDLVDLASDALQRLLGEHREERGQGPPVTTCRHGGHAPREVHVDQSGSLPQGWQGMVETLHAQGLFRQPGSDDEEESGSDTSS